MDQTRISDRQPVATGPAAPAIPQVRIEGILGRGGMGAVWRGRHTFLDRPVAVKTLLVPAGAAGQDFVRRFEREARILASLQHPHVVACHDAGTLPDGSPYLVMEFIEGPSLKAKVERDGPLTETEALRLAREIGEGLAHAHGRGVIHRDVKPENVLLAEHGAGWSAKLVDLGLARPQEAGQDTSLTMAGAVVGTPATMAPEQFSDPDSVDARADMYGLGCTLYYALTGMVAFTGTTLGQLVAQKMSGEIPAVAGLRPDVSPATAGLLAALLHRDRDRRPPTWAACLALIEAARMGSEPLPEEPRVPWPRAVVIGAGIALIAAVLIVAIAIALRRDPPASVTPVPAAPTAETPPPPPPHPLMAARDGEPAWAPERILLPRDLAARLGSWVLAADARWVADPDEDESISGIAGSASVPLPDRPWRLTGTIDLTPDGDFRPDAGGLAIETPQGCISIGLRDAGVVQALIGRADRPGPGLAVVEGDAITLPRPQAEVAIAAWGGRLAVTVDGRPRSVVLPAAPLRLHVWAVSKTSGGRPVPVRIHHLRIAEAR
ncbi:MAG: hypothetical protein RLZZ127_1904 [Planctomycetota bacterium]|jgi:serine/threonine-protein kinase